MNWNMDINAPNLMMICVDKAEDGEITGLIYHRLDPKPVPFCDSGRLLLVMERVCDRLQYPQASTMSHSFGPDRTDAHALPEKPRQKAEEILARRGSRGSFAVWVQYRQNATWQGCVAWVEHDRSRTFFSALELLKLIDSAVNLY